MRILYFHNGSSTFVEKDIEILKSEHEVKIFHFNVSNKKKIIFEFFKQLIELLKGNVKYDYYFIQFAGFHSVLPIILSKSFKTKSIIVLGGTDCVAFPSINYGNFNRYFLGKATKFSLKHANLLLPVDSSLVKYEYNYQDNDFPFQGYLFHAPKVKTKYQVIYNGYEPEKWSISDNKEEKSFVTIGANLGSRFGLQLKGIDLIISLAEKLPDYKFYIVGGQKIKIPTPSNVVLSPTIPNSELGIYLSSKKYYLQLSMSEGFPNALCEAMLCGCIPIVSNVGAMPYIVEDKRLVLVKKDLSLLINLISNVEQVEFEREKIRNRIIQNFNLNQRKEEILKCLKQD